MRICGVVASLGAGGAERVMVELCRGWRARGHEVVLLTLDDSTRDFYAVPAGVERHALDLASPSVNPADAIRSNVSRVRTLRRALRAARADVVVSFTDRTNVLVLMAARGLTLPVVVSERIDPRRHEIGRAWSLLRRLVYPSATSVVVQTESVRRWAEELVPPSRVAVIPNPVRPVTVSGIPAGARPPVIHAMGRLVPQKGFDVLVQAFATIAREHPDWSLVIHGEGPARDSLTNRVASLGLSERILLPGRTANPDAVLGNAAVFALPSRYEGFPNVLLEAMAHGCACVATDCPSGPAELIVSGENGLLTPVDDAFALAHALSGVMQSAEDRTRLGAAARQVSQRFALSHVLGAWDAVLPAERGRVQVAA